MHEQAISVSHPQRDDAIEYMTCAFSGSPFLGALDMLLPHSGEFSVVTGGVVPQNIDFWTDWGSDACTEWLTAEIRCYIDGSVGSLVVFEDISPSNATRSDDERFGSKRILSNGREFWLHTHENTTREAIKHTIACARGANLLILFSHLPDSPIRPMTCSAEVLESVQSAITRVAVDIYDSNGFLIWTR